MTKIDKAHYLLFAGAMISLAVIVFAVIYNPQLLDGITIGMIIGWFLGAFSVINGLVQSGKI